MSRYTSIPVKMAKEIAKLCHKQSVVIVGEDSAHKRLHIVTYGESPRDKRFAARVGDMLRQEMIRQGALGDEKDVAADFRTPSPDDPVQMQPRSARVSETIFVAPEFADDLAATMQRVEALDFVYGTFPVKEPAAFGVEFTSQSVDEYAQMRMAYLARIREEITGSSVAE